MSKGARVLSWRVDGLELVHAEGSHALAVDAFWLPGSFVEVMARVTEQSAADDGFRLKTECVLPEGARQLAGVKVKRELLFPKTAGEFRVVTAVENATADEKTFSFRYANMPSFLTLPKGGEGWADLEGPAGPVRFTRKFLKSAYHLAGAPKTPALDAWSMDVKGEIARPVVRLGCSWSPMQVEAAVPADQLYKLVFWDAGVQRCATLEFVFRQVRLAPGETWQTQMTWRRVR